MNKNKTILHLLLIAGLLGCQALSQEDPKYKRVTLDPKKIPPAGTVLGSGDGYSCSAGLPAGDIIKSFHTTWTVPPKPSGKKLFAIWNSLNGGALQPCLVWEPPYKNWKLVNESYDPLKEHHYSRNKGRPVEPGTSIEGVVSLISRKDDVYRYKVGFTGYPEEDHVSTLPKPAHDFVLCLEMRPKGIEEPHPDFLPPTDYVKMTDIYYETTDGRKIAVTDWKIANVRKHIVTPSGKYTVLTSDGAGGVNVYFYFR